MKKTNLLFLMLGALLCCTATSQAQVGLLHPCEAPPAWADADCTACYSDACDTFKIQSFACGLHGDPLVVLACRVQAWHDYQHNVALCAVGCANELREESPAMLNARVMVRAYPKVFRLLNELYEL